MRHVAFRGSQVWGTLRVSSFEPGWQVNANIQPCHDAAILRAADDPGAAVAAGHRARGARATAERARVAQLRARYRLDSLHARRRVAAAVANRLRQPVHLRAPWLYRRGASGSEPHVAG